MSTLLRRNVFLSFITCSGFCFISYLWNNINDNLKASDWELIDQVTFDKDSSGTSIKTSHGCICRSSFVSGNGFIWRCCLYHHSLFRTRALRLQGCNVPVRRFQVPTVWMQHGAADITGKPQTFIQTCRLASGPVHLQDFPSRSCPVPTLCLLLRFQVYREAELADSQSALHARGSSEFHQIRTYDANKLHHVHKQTATAHSQQRFTSVSSAGIRCSSSYMSIILPSAFLMNIRKLTFTFVEFQSFWSANSRYFMLYNECKDR